MATPQPATKLQHRLMARLVAAIYAIADALAPVIETIAANPARPWQENAGLSHRFYAIIRELLALTARITPASLSKTRPAPSPLPSPLPSREGPGVGRSKHKPPPERLTVPTRPNPAAPFLTARQLARRLAALLHQLECLAAEACAALPARIRRYAAQARAIAGCPQHPASWERAG